MPSSGTRVAGEFGGTAFLLAIVVGSGIMAERLAAGSAAVALLANSIATGCGLVALITALAPVSGAHFNPAVTASAMLGGALPVRLGLAYVLAQFGGAVVGVVCTHAMFAQPLLQVSSQARTGLPIAFAELVATAGLLMIATLCSRHNPAAAPLAVGSYITAAYWFTSSTSFANPAVTVARSLTNTFTGIAPADVPGFVIAQTTAVALVAVCARLSRLLCGK